MSGEITTTSNKISNIAPAENSSPAGTRFGNALKNVENNSGLTEAGARKDAVASLASVYDSLDEASTAVNRYRQQRNRNAEGGSLFSAEQNSADLEDDEHTKIYHIFRVLNTEARDNPRLLLQHMRSLFPDESDLVILLREMLKNSRLTRVQRKTLEETLELATEEADHKKLHAGINISVKAKIFGEKLSLSPGIIRQAYRDFIESDETELELYQSWIALFGSAKRNIIIDFMESALTADMDANIPSSSCNEFSGLLGKLVQLKNIRSSDFHFMKRYLSKPTVACLARKDEYWLFFLFTTIKNPELLRLAFLEAAGPKYSELTPRCQSEVISWLRSCLSILTYSFYSDEKHRFLVMEQLTEYSSFLHKAELSSEHLL